MKYSYLSRKRKQSIRCSLKSSFTSKQSKLKIWKNTFRNQGSKEKKLWIREKKKIQKEQVRKLIKR